MDIFSYFLIRFGGFEYGALEALNYPHFKEDFMRYSDLLNQKEISKERLCETLYRFIGETANKELKIQLITIRRDVFNDRMAPDKFGLFRDLLGALNEPRLKAELREHEDICNSLISIREAHALKYKSVVASGRGFLKNLASNETLKKGLALSSHILLERINEYARKDIKEFSKRELNAELGLLKYLTRSCAKTSPYSTFTTLAIGSIQDLPNPIEIRNSTDFPDISSFRLNGYLLKHFKGVAEQSSDINKFFDIRLSAVLIQCDTCYTFLTTNNKIDALQKVNRNSLLDEIYLRLRQTQTLELQALVASLADCVDSTWQEIYCYLLELLKVGFLEFDLKLNPRDDLWVNKFLKKLNDISLEGNRTQLDKLKIGLTEVHALQSVFPKLNAAERRHKIDSVHRYLQEQVFVEPTTYNQAVLNPDKVFRKTVGKFSLKKELTIYEDVKTHKGLDLDNNHVRELIGSIDILNRVMMSWLPQTKKRELSQFFRKEYVLSERVAFLDFYEHYFKQEKRQVDERVKIQPREFFDKNFDCESRDGVVLFDLKITADQTPSNQSEPLRSYGVFVQPFLDENNALNFVFNQNTLGYGKLMSRFLHLFDESILESLRRWNKNEVKDYVNVGNRDESFFNVNFHPSLFGHEIESPGNFIDGSETVPIELRNLFVIYDESTGFLQLIDRNNSTRFNIVDTGFEGISGRTKLFQLLNTFNDFHATDLRFFANIINGRHSIENDGCVILPRVVFRDKIVLQRKGWVLSDSKKLMQGIGELDYDYFIRINKWRLALKIPNEIYLFLTARESKKTDKKSKLARDDYKPQYIDFISPIGIRLFEKLMCKSESKFKIEEMKPDHNDLLSFDNGKFVSEIWLQWKS